MKPANRPKKKEGGYIITEEHFKGLSHLSDGEFGILLRAVCRSHFYSEDAKELPPKIDGIYQLFLSYSEDIKEKYRDRCTQNSLNAQAKWSKQPIAQE